MDQKNQKTLVDFVNWLPQNIDAFEGQIPEEVITPIKNAKKAEEVVNVLNELSKSEEGSTIIESMFNVFKQSKTELFKEGGKLAQGIKKYQWGGITPRKNGVNGYAMTKVDSDGTRRYALTRGNNLGVDYTNLPETATEFSEIAITPTGDTLGYYALGNWAIDDRHRNYITKSAANAIDSLPFIKRLFKKVKGTEIIPEHWKSEFKNNFNLDL